MRCCNITHCSVSRLDRGVHTDGVCASPVTPLQTSLKERFDWEGSPDPQWQILEGGRPCTDCGVLVEGTALYFSGANARQAVTEDLDLRGAKSVLRQSLFSACARSGMRLDWKVL